MSRSAWLVIALMFASAIGQVSFAKKVAKPDTAVTTLKSLLWGESWGAGKESILAVVKERFDNVWRAQASQMDAYEVDQEIRKSQERYNDVVTSYSELDQNGVEFLASPLKGEFGLGLDQSLLRVPQTDGDLYFLFQEARLAKFVEIVPASKFNTFKAFSNAQQKRLNLKKMSLCNEGTDGGTNATKPAQSVFAVCVMDRTRLYNAYLLIVTDPSTTWRRVSQAEQNTDDLAGLPDIFSEDPSAEDNQELVDELTGTKSKKAKPNRANPPKKKSKGTAGKTSERQKGDRKTKKGLYDDQDVLY